MPAAVAESDSTKSEKTEKPTPEKVRFTVFNYSGDTIQNYTVKADTGLVRMRWDLRQRAPRFPSHEKAKKDDNDPVGRQVVPGTYTIVGKWLTFSDTTTVVVTEDPRLPVCPATRAAYDRARDRYEVAVRAAGRATDQLLDATETLNQMKGNLEQVPDSLRKPLAKTEKALRDSIAVLQGLILSPKDFKGYDGEIRLYDYFDRSSSLLDRREVPSANTLLGIKLLEEKTEEVISRINAFFSNDWAEYRKQVEALPWSPFKPVEMIRLEK